MKKLDKFVDEHKKEVKIFLITLFGIFFVFLIIFFIIPSFGQNTYGNRLDGISEHKISNSTYDKIIDELENKDGVTKASHSIEGKVINFFIETDGTVDINAAEGYTDSITNNLSKDDLKYYDIQVYLTSKKDAHGFPNIGYRHNSDDKFSWGYIDASDE